MSAQANLCQRLIDGGRTIGMTEKIDQLLRYDRITQIEYDHLMQQLHPAAK